LAIVFLLDIGRDTFLLGTQKMVKVYSKNRIFPL